MIVEYAGIVAATSHLAATLTGAYGQNVAAHDEGDAVERQADGLAPQARPFAARALVRGVVSACA